ncbi:MAG: 50S ribosomal protein L32 [Chloroflexi bacterium]|nr:50S ribosomal protein L32 [Chloroflexota bacterium]
MPPLPKKKHSSSRQGGRSSHFALKATSLSSCPQCHQPKLPHRVCTNCGYYKKREAVIIQKETKA